MATIPLEGVGQVVMGGAELSLRAVLSSKSMEAAGVSGKSGFLSALVQALFVIMVFVLTN